MTMQLPSHVPHERVCAVDIYAIDPTVQEHPLSIKAMQRAAPAALFWTPHNGGHWVAARSDLVELVLSDAERFSSRYVTVPKQMNPDPPVAPLQLDPPASQAYRALLAPVLSARASSAVAEHAHQLARQLVQRLQGRGRCEFMQDFARQLPIACFLRMCGLPDSDHALLSDIARRQLDSGDRPAQAQAFQQLGQYLMEHIKSRRANPGSDLISQLAAAEVAGHALDDYRLFGLINMLFVAGLDTVSSAMGAAARCLAQQPALRARLRAKPNLVPRAVEELLRRFPMFTAARVVRIDCALDGVLLKAGDMVVAPTALCGLDEQRFEHAEQVDVERKGIRHASFGAGAHQCPGATLARAELRVFIETWLEQIPDFSLDPELPVRLGPGPVASMLALPLVWEPWSVSGARGLH
jgi:cytochrome P450